MTTVVPTTHRVLTTDHEAELAQDVLRDLAGPQGELTVRVVADASHRGPRPVPAEIGRLLQHVLEAVASGAEISIGRIPAELTTSAAASLLGISRPTLMKMVEQGTIPTHKVGSHTRFRREDVLVERKARRERERQAFRELRAIEDD